MHGMAFGGTSRRSIPPQLLWFSISERMRVGLQLRVLEPIRRSELSWPGEADQNFRLVARIQPAILGVLGLQGNRSGSGIRKVDPNGITIRVHPQISFSRHRT